MSWVAAGAAVTLAATAISTKILTTQLGQAEYGRLALGMTVAVVLSPLAFGPLTTTAARFLPTYRETGRLGPFVGTTYQLALQVSVALAAIGAIASLVAARFVSGPWALLILLCFAFAIFQGLFSVFNTLQNVARYRAAAATHQILIPVSRLVFGSGAVLLVARDALTAAAGLTGGLGLVFLSQLISFKHSVLRDTAVLPPADQVRRDLWRYGRFSVVWGIFAAPQFASDVWALSLFVDIRAVAVYAVAFLIASGSVALAGTAIGQFTHPIAYELAGAAKDDARVAAAVRVINLAAIAMAAIAVLGFSVAHLVAGPVVVLLSDATYLEAASYAPWLILALGAFQVGQLLSFVPMTVTRLRGLLMVKIAASVLTVSCNFLGALTFGIAGVTSSLILTSTAYAIAIAILNARLRPSPRIVDP